MLHHGCCKKLMLSNRDVGQMILKEKQGSVSIGNNIKESKLISRWGIRMKKNNELGRQQKDRKEDREQTDQRKL